MELRATLPARGDIVRGPNDGYALPNDLEIETQVAPSAALVPGLDVTTMGWFDRDWYLGTHRGQVFDRTGNGGPTAWWNGRVVGSGIRVRRPMSRCNSWKILAATVASFDAARCRTHFLARRCPRQTAVSVAVVEVNQYRRDMMRSG